MDFALVGLDCWLPGADGPAAWLERSLAARPALSEAPAARWAVEPATLVDEGVAVPDRTPTLVGGFVDDVPGEPSATDPLFRQVLRVCRGALAGAPGERTDLLLANLSLASTGAVRAASAPYRRWLADRGVDVSWLAGGTDLDLAQSAGPARLAARELGLQGHVAALDAACASSLYAVRLACDRLAAGLADQVIAAAVNRADPTFLFLGFAQLRALSPTGRPRPLDRRADGLVVGEGAAAVRIKRLSDALRDGDRIHAVIRGGGLGNDGRKGNLLAPSPAGQLRTLREAHAQAGVDPASMGYVECHATGTPLGDEYEVRALAELHGERDRPLVLSSAKGVIGHTVTVAGLAGLIKAAGCVRDGMLPPTPAAQPRDSIDGEALAVLDEARPWRDPVRRAGVSAFGFGGTNAHLILESWAEGSDAPPPAVLAPRSGPLAVVAAAGRVGEAADLPSLAAALLDGASLLRPAPAAVTRGLVDLPRGAWIGEVPIEPTRFRIPPRDLPRVLPQQIALLQAAVDALDDAPELDPARVASIVGMGIDLHVAEPVIRQLPRDPALRDAIAPPLDAVRVQGVLPNFVANRIAALLDLHAPSYTVSAGADSGPVALEHARRLLATGAADAAVVGASSFWHLGEVRGDEPVGEAAVALVVQRLEDAEAAGTPVLAVLDHDFQATPAHRAVAGGCGAADGMVALLAEVLRQARQRGVDLPARQEPEHAVVVPHSGPPLPTRAWSGPWGGDTVPAPRPRRAGEHSERIAFTGPARPAQVPLTWARWVGLPERRLSKVMRADEPRPAPGQRDPASDAGGSDPAGAARRRSAAPGGSPTASGARSAAASRGRPAARGPRQASAPPRGHAAGVHRAPPPAARTAELARAVSRSAAALADAHAAFLDGQAQATARLDDLTGLLDRALHAVRGRPLATHEPAKQMRGRERSPLTTPEPARQVRGRERSPLTTPEPASEVPGSERSDASAREPVLDRADLERFATGPISEVLGPAYADLDAVEPRVRLPKPPLLLVDRVMEVEAERGELGPARIVTEYDLDPDAEWNHDGRPPPCVVVESGQADLLLCAILGTDAVTRGESLYRLLDCDLTFHGDRPQVGETLRHDIRIKQFARLGGTLLFYFEYDCTTKGDGRPVLTMRNGCAGFFTPAELARPRGLDASPADKPVREPLPPRIPGAPEALDDRAVRALTAGRHADALGPAFAPADASTLSLPPSRWGLIDRVPTLALSGGPHGLGRVIAEQDLADDDWFNPVHFQGDPCMPGTLMFDGCVQALQVWLLAHGVAADHPEATFEPMPEVAARLRCRGQVAPGHRKLVYDARITEAGLEPTPWAKADVVLFVDGTPVVHAEDIAVRIADRQPGDAVQQIDEASLLEFAVGDPARAFGPAFDTPGRTPRIPGPPLATLHRIARVEGPMGELGGDRTTVAEFTLLPDAWPFAADPGHPLSLGWLLEIALQPCGWTTAWQGSALHLGGDVYFRNLGGTITRHAAVWPDTGTLTTTATLTRLSRSGRMLLVFFDFTVRAGDRVVLAGDTHFGYFTAAALADQKGLSVDDEAERDAWRARATGETVDDLDDLGRDDLRMVDHVTVVAPEAGPEGLGYYEAERAVHADDWFFTAHFHEDPVMPGSLGLEGLARLARWVLQREVGDRPVAPLLDDVAATWTYRGQVLQERERVTYEIAVTELDLEAGRIRCDGIVRVDGLPIYAFESLGAEVVDPPAPEPAPPRREPVAPLLDTFAVEGDQGTGTLRLDPATHPWLAHHQPTLVIPAVPMAFAAEIAAEAARQVRPDLRVVGLPSIEAERWIHTAEGPIDLLIAAVADGDTVAVSLAVHRDNPRFPQLSGPVVHMRAIVQMGEAWAPAPPAPAPLPDAEPVDLPVRDYYDGGWTFHGPVLQAMTDLGVRGPGGAEATLHTRPDPTLLGREGAFVLDPLLLDAATHPMMSGDPQAWSERLPGGRLAYPRSCEGLRLHGPRPEGEITCRLDLVEASPETLAFDVRLEGTEGPWATFRWVETPVPGGPVLGAGPERVHAFAKERRAADVHVGEATERGWRVRRADLVEPLPGSLVRLLCTGDEVDRWRAAEDPKGWLAARVAAKEAVRRWLLERLGRDVHPATLRLVRLRPDRFVVTDATTLTADEQVAHLAPTRFDLVVRADDGGAEAWLAPR